MRQAWGLPGLGVLFLAVWPTLGHAQVVVHDPINNTSILGDVVQNTISALENITQTINSFAELESFTDSPLDGSFVEDLHELVAIGEDIQGVMFDIEVIRLQFALLFDLKTAPDTAFGFQQRLSQIRQVKAEMLGKARIAQTLPGRISRVIGRIEGIAGRILEVIGAKQSGQQLQAIGQQLTHVALQTQVIQAAYNQAILTQESEKPLIEESLQRIHEQAVSDWPGWAR